MPDELLARLDRTDLPGVPGSARFAELLAYYVIKNEDEEQQRREDALKNGVPLPPAKVPFGSKR